jgi:uncharacterized protein (TIGR02266 family)
MGGEGARNDAWADEAPTRDRRASERSPIEVEVSLSSESQFFAGLSGDVSLGGLFVQTYSLRPVGTQVNLAFSLPTGEIQVSGVVRWVRGATDSSPPGLGIAFEHLEGRELAAVEAFCRTRPPLYHDIE